MSQRTKPPFRADQVGSLLRSGPVKEARTIVAELKKFAADLAAKELEILKEAVPSLTIWVSCDSVSGTNLVTDMWKA